MTPGRAVLVALMDRYIRVLLDPFITRLEVHKLMYFMQVAGQPLRLQFVKGAYGPYAENLRHVLGAVEGHFIAGYRDGGGQPKQALGVSARSARRCQYVPSVARGRTQSYASSARPCGGVRDLLRAGTARNRALGDG